MKFLINSWILPILTFFIIQKSSSTNFIKDNVTLTIEQGTLFGEKILNYLDDEVFYTFNGIPYAKPPLGALRFKTPEPAEPWIGVYDATQVRPMCPQIYAPALADLLSLGGLNKSEDCIFLTVHTKMSSKPKPVMVWIHGGGLTYGSIFEENYGPELLMTEDIVLVKIAYRLNIFGFLSIDDSKYDIPGNAGFKDQVLALKWVQKNIHHFGGDPNQVTIFGESAGGAAVQYLIMSPLAKGLFHRAISQSGAADSPWLTSPHKYPALAKALKCSSEKLNDIVHCINGTTTDLLNALEIINESQEFNKKLKNGELMKFNCLTIEKEHPNSFIADKTENIIKSGKYNTVPTMIGFTSNEGEIVINWSSIKPDLTDYRKLIPKDIKIDLESEEAYQLGKKIKEFYYGDQKPSHDLLDNYIDYMTDVLILEKVYKFTKLHANTVTKVPTYFYQLDLFTKLNVRYPANPNKRMVVHFDDVRYLFYSKDRIPEPYFDSHSKEFIGIHRMLKLWTTFAKTGNPNPVDEPLIDVKWLPIEPNKFNYLKISDDLELKQNPAEERMKFWEEVYSHYLEDHKLCESSSEQCS
ncbi:carboxylesterase 1F-like isoform X2 [Chrysoperla carnea]|uniref:carboxylesterase 1F-like isoform X2 n=1 Tax=Chrysoperla carnea TaxID=189513 RepID=UPI001D087BC8|nr:carboxylesterase 1F-like isoform X2 [Chrysoperla carnea]